MDERLTASLERGVLTVARGARLARQLRWQFARHRRAGGEQVFASAPIVTWEGWVRALADDALWSAPTAGAGPRTLLSTSQELALWEQVIGASAEAHLINTHATAVQAREAWSLVQRWRLPDPGRSSSATAEARAFSRWMRAYHARCSDGAWLDSARLTDAVRRVVRTGDVIAPPAMVLYGFDDLDPQQRRLLKALEEAGTTITTASPTSAAGSPRRLSFDDSDDEITAIARWVRYQLSAESELRVGVVLPDPGGARRRVERVFDAVLAPEALLPGGAGAVRPYNIAGGVPLVGCPPVRGALDILALCRRRVSIDGLGAVLRGPWCAEGMAQGSIRASFDLWLRSEGFAEVSTVRLATLAPRYRDSTRDGRLVESLTGGFRLLAASGFANRRPQPAGSWAREFRSVLDAFGWPGRAQASPRESAEYDAFRDLLNEFARLDMLGLKFSVDQALDRLTRMADGTRFRYRPEDAPVQIMSPEQARGLAFDALWIGGMDDDSWPPPARANPFIPMEWQRRHGLPGATAQGSLDAARRCTSGLLAASAEPVVSWVTAAGDQARAPSPLIAECPIVELSALPLGDDPREALDAATPAELERFVDDTAPPLSDVENVRGAGARLFELQARCPFRAFAVERLGADEFDEPRPGLDPRARGHLMHMTLEHTWNRLGNREALVRTLGSEHLENLVWQAAETALELFARRRAAPISERLRELERMRLVSLVLSWLEIEAERAPFDVVAAETARTLEVGGLEVSLRIDRIDRIDGFGEAIVDYKSGRCTVADWIGPRPEAPQLPLYALTQDEPPAAVLFAQLRAGDNAFVGVGVSDGLVPGMVTYDGSHLAKATGVPWEGLRDHWRAMLDDLGRHFRAGDARVDPKDPAQTCRYCHLSALCRIAEAEPADE